jgi:hypothetical protein
MADDDEIRITLRLPASLRDGLQKAAEANARSMNGEIVARLRHFNELWEENSELRSRLRFEASFGDDLRRRLDGIANSTDAPATARMLAQLEMERLELAHADLKETQESIDVNLARLLEVNRENKKQVEFIEKLREEVLKNSDFDESIHDKTNDKISETLISMQDELAALSKERGDHESETNRLLKEQTAAIEQLRESNRMTYSLLEKFREAFFEAVEGDTDALQKLGVDTQPRATQSGAKIPLDNIQLDLNDPQQVKSLLEQLEQRGFLQMEPRRKRRGAA